MEVQAKNHLSEELNKIKMARIDAERSDLVSVLYSSPFRLSDIFSDLSTSSLVKIARCFVAYTFHYDFLLKRIHSLHSHSLEEN